ncbi:ABC transporter type 1/ ATPase component [Synechococcus sp. BIOS-E4-1]|uniref:ABC transporter ATP-binding protein n=1 Tax=Synechococcus sp. BIOS-E4-1 TaxID=1400864 RepID=UPI0016485489|nr:ABC transporter ATP-binding protein [Synechococcus sp. BIOS-E4-1]QNI52866.1 ABC transporter type 1/ ATPase component [Synechococcus sp. BIOS-E4-1]
MTQAESLQVPHSTRFLLLSIWGHLSSRRRIQLTLLLVVMLASGVAELVSLGAVLPFLAVISDPQRLWQNTQVQEFAPRVGLTESSQLLVPAIIAFAMAAVLAAFVRLVNVWLNGRLAAAIGADLSSEAYRRTLYQPYEVHLHRNTAEVITCTTSQINQTVGALNALLQIITSSVVAAALITGLLVIDAQVALATAVLFGSAYFALAITVRRELRTNGHKIALAITLQLKTLQEGLGAIRDVLLDGSQATYLQIYRRADRPQRQLQAKNAFLGTFPRYALEALGMVSIALVGGLLVTQRGSGTTVIPLLGALALGAQRLLPALQQIFSGWAALKSYNADIQAVINMLNQSMPSSVIAVEPLLFRSTVHIKGVYYRYGPAQPYVLKGLDLEIRCGERIGLIGSTGSGKSTILDLLMGLLEPTAGNIFVDGEDVHDLEHPERLMAWRAAIAHVPQSIYLADSSIAENIAFGVPRDQIDLARVKQAAQQAQISNFIENSLEGYWSFVGERGIRLSGGQRQRIGIARALYKKARLLVLDEATSALDNNTEAAVMHSFEDLSRSLTVVIVAHRLSTLSSCDRVIEMEQGCIARQTTGAKLGSFYE